MCFAYEHVRHKLSTDLMHVDCQDFLSTSLMEVVSTTFSKSACTVGVKRMSPVDTELLFIILWNIIALHRNTNIFFLWKSSNLNKSLYNYIVLSVGNPSS